MLDKKENDRKGKENIPWEGPTVQRRYFAELANSRKGGKPFNQSFKVTRKNIPFLPWWLKSLWCFFDSLENLRREWRWLSHHSENYNYSSENFNEWNATFKGDFWQVSCICKRSKHEHSLDKNIKIWDTWKKEVCSVIFHSKPF